MNQKALIDTLDLKVQVLLNLSLIKCLRIDETKFVLKYRVTYLHCSHHFENRLKFIHYRYLFELQSDLV